MVPLIGIILFFYKNCIYGNSKSMDIIFLFLFTPFVLFLAGNAFYVAFKTYEENDDFTANIEIHFLELIFVIILWFTEKYFPERLHIRIFKTFAFLFGLSMLGLLVLIWTLE